MPRPVPADSKPRLFGSTMAERRVVKELLALAARGEPRKVIVRLLNEAGHRTKTGRRWWKHAVDCVIDYAKVGYYGEKNRALAMKARTRKS